MLITSKFSLKKTRWDLHNPKCNLPSVTSSKGGFNLKSLALSFPEPGVWAAPTPHRQECNGDAETTPTAPCRHCWPKGPRDTQVATQIIGGYLNLSPSPFHPLLRDDIKWKWYAFERQEADKQEAQLSLSFVQPAVKYMQ